MKLTEQEAARLRDLVERWEDGGDGEMYPVCVGCGVDFVRHPHKPDCIFHEFVPDPVERTLRECEQAAG